MKILNKISVYAGTAILFALIMVSCQKMNRPVLGADYPKDANPPGGPLKFYAALDGTAADSIRANFGTDNNVTYVDGVNGKAYKGSDSSFIQYSKPNDFASATSFTIAFWIKKTPQPAGSGTNFVFSLNSNGYSWTNEKLFLEFEDAGNPSTMDSAAAKLYILDQWFEYTGSKRLLHVLDGQWHQLAFTYDEATSVLSTYVDGQPVTTLPAGFGNVTNNGAPRGKLDFSGVDGFTLGGAGTTAHNANGWMGTFDGSIDQFRLYATALSAADIAALYTSKL